MLHGRPRRWSRRTLGMAALLAMAGASAAGFAEGPWVEASATDDTNPYLGVLTFDWPLGCPVGVSQQYYDAGMAIDVAYDVRLVDSGSSEGITAEFGEATVVDVAVDDLAAGVDEADLDEQLAAFFTNPTLEVALDGEHADVVGFAAWLDDFRAVGPSADEYSSSRLGREIDFRSSVATWGTWVGVWAELEVVDSDHVEVADDDNLDEFLDATVAPLTVESGDRVEGLAVLHAERTLEGSALRHLWRHGYDPATGKPVEYDDAGAQRRVTTLDVVTDPSTLRPRSAAYEVNASDGDDAGELVVAFEWAFDWEDCDSEPSVLDVVVAPVTAPASPAGADEPAEPTGGGAVAVPPGMDTIALVELPDEARDTLVLILQEGPFPYRQDGAVFENREGVLPDMPPGYYREYTVETPGSDDRGARRLVVGDGGETYYTDDHYDSFKVVLR